MTREMFHRLMVKPLGWRVDTGDRAGGQRERGRLDRIELRLDLDDCIVLVAVVEETAEPNLIRQLNVGQWGERDHHAHEKQHEGPARPHHSPLLRGSLENVKPSRSSKTSLTVCRAAGAVSWLRLEADSWSRRRGGGHLHSYCLADAVQLKAPGAGRHARHPPESEGHLERLPRRARRLVLKSRQRRAKQVVVGIRRQHPPLELDAGLTGPNSLARRPGLPTLRPSQRRLASGDDTRDVPSADVQARSTP